MLALNTLQYAKELQQYGFTREQAEGQAQTLGRIIDENLATKYDIELIRRDIKELEASNKRDLEEVRADLKRDMKELEMRLTVRLGGIMVAGVGIIATLVKIL